MNQQRFLYWCHYRAIITSEDPPRIIDAAMGVIRIARITEFSDVFDMAAAIANTVAKEQQVSEFTVTLLGWTPLETTFLLPPLNAG